MKTKYFTCFALVLAFTLAPAFADTFTDDFSGGINPTNWFAVTNSPRFSIQDSNGFVNIQSSNGTSNGFFWGYIYSTVTAYGDFDVSIDFTNANLTNLDGGTGSNPSNQAQLNCYFGNFATGASFLMVRDNEKDTGQNAHVWLGGSVLGSFYSTSLTSGTLRITRTNSLVSGFLNSVLIAESNYTTAPAFFSFCLQNNGTSNSISIRYNNFQVTADHITAGTPLTIQPDAPDSMVLSWPTWGADWTTNYVLQYASNFNEQDWQTVTNVPITNEGILSVTGSVYITNSVSSPIGFYRLILQ